MTPLARRLIAAALAVAALANGQAATVTATAALGMTLAATMTATAAPVRVVRFCAPRLRVTGAATTGMIAPLRKLRAERRARQAWRSVVVAESGTGGSDHPSRGLGVRYADLAKARDMLVDCEGGAVMWCTVAANPCG